MKNIFFVGIGGIGMSSLAIYSQYKGYAVSGSDKDLLTKTVILLKQNNITVFDEDLINESILNTIDILIITNTISIDHKLYNTATKLNKKILYRSQFLKNLIYDKYIIGITGSHGKTTTTGLLGHIFKENHEDPTIFVGGIMKNYKKNILIGNSKYLIIEADDAYKSFLDLYPFISIITSISYEHLETYKNLDDIENAFLKFTENTNKSGIVIINNDTEFLKKFINKINHPNIITYGLNNNSDYSIQNIQFSNTKSYFSLFYKKKFLSNHTLNLLGLHNIKNATATIIASLYLNINLIKINNALLSFKGVERRFQYKGKFNNLKVYDDYAHHPNEIDAILSTLKAKKTKAYIFWQPHKYIRTKHLWHDFISVFIKYETTIEILYITDVYASGDNYDNIYNSENLVKELKNKITNVFYVPFDTKFEKLSVYKINLIKRKYKTIILTLGAGLMNRFSDFLVKMKNLSS